MALSYVSYGIWQQVTDNGATLGVAQQYLLYGIRQAADQPSTGSASYTTLVDGLWANPDGVYSLGGTSSFTANFAAKTVATTLDLVGKHVSTGVSKTLGQFNGSGTIATLGGGFSGTLTHQGTDIDGNIYSGNFAGAFFGPQGQEMGYTFNLTGNGGAAVGAVVGKSN
nr:transferrin-binding protein-like solute binding protein [Sphingomonas sp. ID1715]